MADSVCRAGINNCKCVVQIELADRNFMCFVKLTKGEFMMGARGYPNEEPVHRVVVEQDFYLGTTPVTQRQARVLMQRAGIDHTNAFDGNDNRPAEEVSAEDADACCAWLQNHLQQTRQIEVVLQGKPLEARLPTEAEWEYACKYRWVLDTEYHTGDGAAALVQAGWFGHAENFGDNKGAFGGQTHDVAQLSPNAAGLYDMHGNVWEWCLDGWNVGAYRSRPDGVRNPFVSSDGNAGRVIRGGSWGNHAASCRAAFRGWWGRGSSSAARGFRVGLFPARGPFVSRADQ